MLAIETYQYPEMFCSPFDDFFEPVSIFGFQCPNSAAMRRHHQRQQLQQHKKRKVQPSKWHRAYNCAQFKPSEISIKVDDRQLVVTATKVLANEANGEYESIQHVRKCTIPDNVQVEAMKSFMDHRGMLRLEAPLAKEEKPDAEASTSSSSSDNEESMDIDQQQQQPAATSVHIELQQQSPVEEPKAEATPKPIPDVVIEDVGEE